MTLFSKKKVAYAASALALGVASFSTQAYAASRIQGVTAAQISANTTQLRIRFDGVPVSPVAYQQSGSKQLVLDFNQVSASLPRSTNINTGAISNVTTVNSGSATRLMVNLRGATTYTSRVEGNQLLVDVVELKGVSANTQPLQVAVNPLLSPANAQNSSLSNTGVSSINYANGTVNIALTNEAIPVDVQRQGNKIVVRTTGNPVPRHLLRRINAGGLVSNIDVNNQGKNGVITLNMTGDFEYQAYQSGAQLVVSVKPAKMLTEPTMEQKVYKGESLSMEFQDVPIRTVLDVLMGFTGKNIVAADNVQGNITLRLINVPWDQALDVILKSKKLAKRENGNVILVAPAEELATEEAKELEAKNKIKDLAPLRTEYIRLNYAKAQAVFELFEKATSNGSRGSSDGNNTAGLLSSRGSVIVDTRTNTLIVKDTSESISNIRAMIDKIDIPVSQVMIQARIVNANDGFSKEIGVRWGLAHNSRHGNRLLQGGGSMDTLWNIREGIGEDKTTIERPANLAVDLGSTRGSAGRIAFGLLNIADSILDLELSAMQTDNRGEIISSPKVLTADKQRARISSGTQIPYTTTAPNGGTTTEWKEAALVLEVTPNITPDGKIGLELNVRNGNAELNGAISEDSIQTNVLLEDGQTIVLGGVFQQRNGIAISKVPFLGDLPYVGRLFKNQYNNTSKQELLIFVTPKLINDGVSRIN